MVFSYVNARHKQVVCELSMPGIISSPSFANGNARHKQVVRELSMPGIISSSRRVFDFGHAVD